MNPPLAIVIPAYKKEYFFETLCSISNQTCKNFTLYIGDDASPDNLYDIVRQFESKITIVFKRFENNLGGKDLVAQWERCIDMVQDEEWLWLFSDDDLMDENCVSSFYQVLEEGIDSDLYHFNVQTIDDKSKVLSDTKKYPTKLDVYSFYKMKMKGTIKSFVTENIFLKNKFLKEGRFQNFDLAWGSDTATWVKIANEKGIYTIENAFVYWRASNLNISPNMSPDLVLRKIDALNDFLNWSVSYFKSEKFIKIWNLFFFLKRIIGFSPYMEKSCLRTSLKKSFFINNFKHRVSIYFINLLLILVRWFILGRYVQVFNNAKEN